MMRDNERSMFGIVEGRWNLAIVKSLLDGPKRFTEIRKILGEISANVLARKLKEMRERGLIKRGVMKSQPPTPIYELTAWGYQGRRTLDELRNWWIMECNASGMMPETEHSRRERESIMAHPAIICLRSDHLVLNFINTAIWDEGHIISDTIADYGDALEWAVMEGLIGEGQARPIGKLARQNPTASRCAIIDLWALRKALNDLCSGSEMRAKERTRSVELVHTAIKRGPISGGWTACKISSGDAPGTLFPAIGYPIALCAKKLMEELTNRSRTP